MSHQQNITRIRVVYNALEELCNEVVFVGGATVSLYADRPAGETRPTEDVDILIELLDYRGYAGIEEKLRRKGFVNDKDSGVICRYQVQGIVVDVMPTGNDVLGFSNQWYTDGYASSMEKDLGEGIRIRLFQAPYFIASKLEAFKSRGGGDGRMSSDFEDLVFIFNNRNAVWNELRATESGLRKWLQEEIRTLLQDEHFYEWISAHLEFSEQRRAVFIKGGLEDFVRVE